MKTAEPSETAGVKPFRKAEPADFPRFEAEMLEAWHKEQTFQQSLKQRQGGKRFSFYDGPPFANGLPHFGHSLVTSIKDALGRYRTMRGYYVERRNGWDCHGLPVEFAIEKELGVSGKKQILQLGLEQFNQACRQSVFKYKGDWEEFFRRIGRWTEFDRAYATIDRDYTESVWWVLGQIHHKGLLYRGYKSMPYCPRCETPISNFELNEGYRDDVKDPSVYVKFQLQDEPNTALVAWTTTPWTLPANAALAVSPAADYVTVELPDRSRLILAKTRIDVLDLRQTEYKIIEQCKGRDLAGRRYRPLFRLTGYNQDQVANAHQVYLSDVVSLDDGTGVLHIAPRYGEDDLELGQQQDLPLYESVDASGRMVGQLDFVAGQFFKEADPHIIAELSQRDAILAAEIFTHTYPFCYRCESPLLYFAISTWFVKVSAIRDQLLKTAAEIEWTPAHIKDGRFGKWLEGAKDWAISRNRYWGAPLPIWVNEDDANDYLVVSSLAELNELAGSQIDLEDLHRPQIDEIILVRNGRRYRRIEEVFDCWFESGSMPVAQQHYPFNGEDVFKASFPADYIGEGLDQTRLWFYVLHVISTILFKRPAYKNVLVNGMVMAADGQKLSKRLRNYPPVQEVFASYGADTLRFYLLSNDQALGGDYMRFSENAMKDVGRNLFMTLWNVHSFFTTYAEVDGWAASSVLRPPSSDNVLDRWLLSRLDQTITEMTKQADSYQIARALRPLTELVDDLSNWYVRRSRRRFWKSEDDSDKQAAYTTLHYVLVRISQLLAPWAPFISDKLYRDLTRGMGLPESVHLTDWPETKPADTSLIEQMLLVREAVKQGLALRAAAKIKVRQPLSKASLKAPTVIDRPLLAIAAEELNVKVATAAKASELSISLDTVITPELKFEGWARDIIRLIQSERKQLGLQVDDRIVLTLSVPVAAELVQAIKSQSDLIAAETLATKLELVEGEGQTVPQLIEEQKLYIEINKIS